MPLRYYSNVQKEGSNLVEAEANFEDDLLNEDVALAVARYTSYRGFSFRVVPLI